SLAGQPIITSLLIGDNGQVQGYRVVNDPRIEGNTRIAAFGLADVFKGIAGMGLKCTDLPLAEGERPIDDWFVKESCEKTGDGVVVHIEARRFFRASPKVFATIRSGTWHQLSDSFDSRLCCRYLNRTAVGQARA